MIVHFEGNEEVLDREFNLKPLEITPEFIKFQYEGQQISFFRSPAMVTGYAHPTRDNKFFFVAESEWARELIMLEPTDKEFGES